MPKDAAAKDLVHSASEQGAELPGLYSNKDERLNIELEHANDIETVGAEALPRRRLGKIVNSVDELIHVLREEAQVI